MSSSDGRHWQTIAADVSESLTPRHRPLALRPVRAAARVELNSKSDVQWAAEATEQQAKAVLAVALLARSCRGQTERH